MPNAVFTQSGSLSCSTLSTWKRVDDQKGVKCEVKQELTVRGSLGRGLHSLWNLTLTPDSAIRVFTRPCISEVIGPSASWVTHATAGSFFPSTGLADVIIMRTIESERNLASTARSQKAVITILNNLNKETVKWEIVCVHVCVSVRQ